MGRRRSEKKIAGVVTLLVLSSAFVFRRDPFVAHVLVQASLLALISLAWNILGGGCGQISFGHAAFFGTGAYVSAILTTQYHLNPWLGIAGACVSVVFLSLLVGVPSFRLKGAYFALLILAYAHVLKLVALNLEITKGDEGIFSIPSFGRYSFGGMEVNFFTSKGANLFLILLFLIAGLWTGIWMRGSQTGIAMEAVREDEVTAEAMGIDTLRYKLFALGVSAFFTALGGAFYVHYIHFLTPDSAYSGYWSLMPIVAALFGGIRTVTGPVVGAFTLVCLDEFLIKELLPRGDKLVYGLLFVVTILFFPRGILGTWVERQGHGRKKEG